MTCDQTQLLTLCQNCFIYGNHEEHNYKVIEVSSGFCNCGDLTGSVYCRNHERVRIPDISKPLHVNDRALNEFSQITGIPLSDARVLAQLNQIRTLSNNSSDGELIKNYFDNSRAQEHMGYGNLSIRKSYSVYRKDHEIKFVNKGYDKQRRLLLWHGSKRANLNGILTNGFRLPLSGTLMFGKGVYFADRVTKSSRYCDEKGCEFLFLCEVALGSMY